MFLHFTEKLDTVLEKEYATGGPPTTQREGQAPGATRQPWVLGRGFRPGRTAEEPQGPPAALRASPAHPRLLSCLRRDLTWRILSCKGGLLFKDII